ncbi:DMT family transporter [Nocardioides marmoriginsengisoli]|uniref:DMT family transporter n=1 Tax=Nocardioides marmoriginsengisoli TaxID=661483 RepID=A0A3N0CIG7_9ACTN|nr:DMT family transporter [Nocardioides marmoriginsengisoli]RNL63242.1 DMT family transporter [Nocardioides marmoriginsengisoli]
MKQFTHDAPQGIATGLGWALLSAALFGTSGALGSGLMDAGWSAGGAVAARVSIAALVLLVPAWIALDGRWSLLRAELGTLVAYGLVAVAGCQLAYFNAIQHMEVGVALLIEYAAPVAVLGWAWFRHGQRPGRVTILGSVVAVLGLVLVLDVVSGASVSIPGVSWSLLAMVGAAVYFILSARRSELPPLVLAGGGLALAAVTLIGAGAIGVLDLSGSTRDVDYSGTTVPFWAPLLALGLLSGAIAYVSGIAASRRLGSRVASFVALIEVLFALLFAWLLLRQLPGAIQFAGAGLVLIGVIVVKAGEKQTVRLQVAPEPDTVLAEAA